MKLIKNSLFKFFLSEKKKKNLCNSSQQNIRKEFSKQRNIKKEEGRGKKKNNIYNGSIMKHMKILNIAVFLVQYFSNKKYDNCQHIFNKVGGGEALFSYLDIIPQF